MKNRLINEKNHWFIVVEDGFGNEISRDKYKDRDAAETARIEAFNAAEEEKAKAEGRAPRKRTRKAPAGDRQPARVNRTRPPVTASELPGETVTNANQATVAEAKMPADKQPTRLAVDKGRAPPPIKQVNKPAGRK